MCIHLYLGFFSSLEVQVSQHAFSSFNLHHLSHLRFSSSAGRSYFISLVNFLMWASRTNCMFLTCSIYLFRRINGHFNTYANRNIHSTHDKPPSAQFKYYKNIKVHVIHQLNSIILRHILLFLNKEIKACDYCTVATKYRRAVAIDYFSERVFYRLFHWVIG